PPDLSAPVEQYQHQPLDLTKQQIRLITVRRSPENGPIINCIMKVFDLSDVPPYTALSYTWGPATPKRTVHINGRELQIRKNLFDFLWEFRNLEDLESSDQYIWIDQIVIDQSNYGERSHQVQMMRLIYKGAESVIAWLGLGSA
ncbi:heterokaryon incompatibility protein-domain-containing protein, partial [Phaeosphaeriaceae sp. PMI808]